MFSLESNLSEVESGWFSSIWYHFKIDIAFSKYEERFCWIIIQLLVMKLWASQASNRFAFAFKFVVTAGLPNISINMYRYFDKDIREICCDEKRKSIVPVVESSTMDILR